MTQQSEQTPCRVVGCICYASEPSRWHRRVCTIGVCAIHQQFPDEELAVLLRRKGGLVAPLERITDRIEYGPA